VPRIASSVESLLAEVIEEKRWLPLWLSVVLLVLAILAAIAMLNDAVGAGPVDWREAIGGLPLIALLLYLLLCGLLNRTRVSIEAAALRVSHGPMPGVGTAQSVPRDAIRRCYARTILAPTRRGAAASYAAGVETRDDRRIDLLASYESRNEALAAARRIAGALNQGGSQTIAVDWIEGLPWRRNRQALRRPLGWCTAFVLALALIFLLELTR